MRQFASSGFRIWNLGREAKVLYTFFGVFALLAFFVSVVYYEDLMGSSVAGARLYYAGGRVAGETTAPPPVGSGPKIELPEEAAVRVREPLSYRHLLEVTHFHLFTVPVFLLIVAHLFMLTGLRPTAKLAWILAASLSSLAHLGAPWWVRYRAGSAAALVPATGAIMLAAFGFMTVYSIWAMWRAPGPRADNSRP
jgi:hypothetical protein